MLGYLYAKTKGTDVIADTDDDNSSKEKMDVAGIRRRVRRHHRRALRQRLPTPAASSHNPITLFVEP